MHKEVKKNGRTVSRRNKNKQAREDKQTKEGGEQKKTTLRREGG